MSFLTQLVQAAFDPGFAEDGKTGVLLCPVYAPNYDVLKFEPVADPGLKGRARDDANRYGAAWAEFNYYMELGGFNTYEDSGTKYDPPFWGVVMKALGMKQTANDGTVAAWIYEVVDDIHLFDDTVHPDGELTPLDFMANLDGLKFMLANAIGNGTFSLDVNAGPPRLTVDSFMGNIFEDLQGNTYHYPIKDMPLDFTANLTGDETITNAAPDATECTAALATFVTDGVAVGDIAFNETTGEQALVTVVVGETELTTAAITSLWTAGDVVIVYSRLIDFDAPVTADADNITVGISVITTAGATVVISDTCFRSWTHNLGNAIAEQRCGSQEFKLDQFLLANQNANTATLTIRVPDPGTQASPDDFNPYLMAEQHDMLRMVLVHNPGATLGQITFASDYYISEVINVVDDGSGVLEYTLALKQANLLPTGVAAQYLKVSLA